MVNKIYVKNSKMQKKTTGYTTLRSCECIWFVITSLTFQNKYTVLEKNEHYWSNHFFRGQKIYIKCISYPISLCRWKYLYQMHIIPQMASFSFSQSRISVSNAFRSPSSFIFSAKIHIKLLNLKKQSSAKISKWWSVIKRSL
jgi:hypothetical protein